MRRRPLPQPAGLPLLDRLIDDDPVAVFDLRVIPWGDGSRVPTWGTNLLFLGTANDGLLHIRIFDALGNLITDTDETRLPETKAEAIAALKQQLPGLLPPHRLTGAEKAQLRAEATSVVGQIPVASAEVAPRSVLKAPSIDRAIREAIGRDLEILLNTRQRLVQPPPGMLEPTRSILDFGLPSARGTNLATAAGRLEFGQTIEGAIRCFEPRVRDVQVTVEVGVTPLDPLRLVIAAKLASDPGGEPWRFEASWSASSGRVRVEEART